MAVSPKVIRSLPKADLHSHIDGSIPAKELFRIARRNGRRVLTSDGNELDSVTAFTRYIEGEGYGSMLEDIIDRFYPITSLMQTGEVIREVGATYVGNQKGDGIAYTEGRFAPQYHTREGLSLKEVIMSMAEGLKEGEDRYGVKATLIVAIGRESSPELGVEVAKAAAGCGVVALDLGGPERGNPPQKFKDAFRIAKNSGVKATVHAGEGAGSVAGNLANIESAITQLGADRVGHAIDLARSSRLISLVRRGSIGVEMNPISNLVLKKIADPGDLRINQLLNKRVRVTVNSDDPALWPKGDLSSVYHSVCGAYGFGMTELDALVENSFRCAFVSRKEQVRLTEEYLAARRRSN